jgi:hypothetical protein
MEDNGRSLAANFAARFAKAKKTKEVAPSAENLPDESPESETETENSPFSSRGYSEIPIPEEDAKHIRILIKQTSFKRQRKFRLEDHLFNLIIQPIDKDPKKAPLLLGLVGALKNVIEWVLIKLRAHYVDRSRVGQFSLTASEEQSKELQDRHVMLTISERHLERGLIIGHFGLDAEDPSAVASLAAEKLFSWLDSNKTIRVNESFQVHFKVLSDEHAAEKFATNSMPKMTLRELEAERRSVRQGHYKPRRQLRKNPMLGDSESDEGDVDDPVPSTSRGFDSLLGAKKREKSSAWKFATPTGFSKNVDIFQNECLFVSLAIGKLLGEVRRRFEDDSSPQEKSLCKFPLNQTRRCLTKAAGTFLNSTVEELTCQLGLARNEKQQQSICHQIVDLWNVQIFIFSDDVPTKLLGCYPPEWQLNLPVISLLLTKPNYSEASSHVSCIKNLQTFFNLRGFACPSCQKRKISFQARRHKCRIKKTCNACGRFLKTAETLEDPGTQFLFCDGSLSNEEAEECESCHLFLRSGSCKEAHGGRFCQNNGWECPECHLFESKYQKFGKSEHICFSGKRCKTCLQEIGENHLCSWIKPWTKKILDNVGFLHFSTTSTSAICLPCFEMRPLFCHLHNVLSVQNEIEPVVCGLFYENQQHGRFSRLVISDKRLGPIPIENENDSLEFDYFSEYSFSSREFLKVNTSRQPKLFNKPRKLNSLFQQRLEILREKEEKSVAEEFISTTFCSDFQNFTFVTSSHNAITFLVKALVTNGLPPRRPVFKDANIILVTIDEYDISFICSKGFISGSLSEQMDHLGILEELYFFPQAINHKDLFQLQQEKAPNFEYYIDLTDGEDLLKKKEKFWFRIKDEKWVFADSLIKSAKSELMVHAYSCLNLLKAGFSFQKECDYIFKSPMSNVRKNKLPFLQMFSFCSLGSFVFDSFRLFALPQGLLYIIANPYGRQEIVSEGETEWTECLRFCHPGKWKTAFSSPIGQVQFFKKQPTEFKMVKPDAFGGPLPAPFDRAAAFFNGCFVHGHPAGLCQREKPKEKEKLKKMLEEMEAPSYKAKYARFERMQQFLFDSHSDKFSHLLVIWQCQWERQKLVPEIRDILEKAGPVRPKTRLVPHRALKGPLSECYKLKFVANSEERAFAIDMSSLFPFVAIAEELPVKKYQIYIGDNLRQGDISFTAIKMLFRGDPVSGICHCKVYPPKDLLFPFLLTFVNGQSMGTLCWACSLKTKKTICDHGEEERSFTDCYTTDELAYAQSLGYNFFFFELHLYKEVKPFLRKFLTLLGMNKFKIKKV